MIDKTQVTPGPDPADAELQKRGFVGYCDIVESVRLYESHGPQLGRLWETAIETVCVGREGCEILKVEGDALIYATERASDAADIALAMSQQLAQAQIDGRAGAIQLRTGLVEGPYWTGRHTSYGSAINLAARLAGIALPGEVLLSEAVRLFLSARFDLQLTDRGDCFLRNVAAPVRIHALHSNVPGRALPLMIPDASLRLRIAVLPPAPLNDIDASRPLSDAIADAISTELSTVPGIGVISHLSTRRVGGDLRGPLEAAKEMLGAHYILSGRCQFAQDRFDGWLELSDTSGDVIVWSGKIGGLLSDLFQSDGLAADISRDIVGAVFRGEYDRAKAQPLPAIENHTLMITGVNLMHSLSEREFQRARQMLETLAGRASRTAAPLAWLARWHNLRVLQGWSSNPDQDARSALDLCRRALDADPSNALALTMLGMTMTHLKKRLDLAHDHYDAALAANRSEPLAWLLRGALRSFTDDPDGALSDVYEANALSPLDPQRYYFLTLTAGAHLTAGEDDRALEFANQSLRFNRHHLSSWRIKAVAEWRTGQSERARKTAQELLRRDPGFTVSNYLSATPSAKYQIGREIAKSLRSMGIPA